MISVISGQSWPFFGGHSDLYLSGHPGSESVARWLLDLDFVVGGEVSVDIAVSRAFKSACGKASKARELTNFR